MHKRITFRHMEHSPVLEDYANNQLGKVIDFLANERSPIFVDLVFEPSKKHAHHMVELRIKSPQFDRISSYESPDFYDALDRVIDTMYLELREDKKRIQEDKKVLGRHEDFKKER